MELLRASDRLGPYLAQRLHGMPTLALLLELPGWRGCMSCGSCHGHHAAPAWPSTNSTLLQVELLGRFESQGDAARCYDCVALKRAGPSCSRVPLNFSIHDYALLPTGEVVVAPAGHQAAAQHTDYQLGSASATSMVTPTGRVQQLSTPAGMPSAAENAKARREAAQHASHPSESAALATGVVGRESSHQMGSLQGGTQLALGPTQPQHSGSGVRGHTDSMGALQNAPGASLGSCGTMAPAPFASAAVAASQGPLAQVRTAACGFGFLSVAACPSLRHKLWLPAALGQGQQTLCVLVCVLLAPAVHRQTVSVDGGAWLCKGDLSSVASHSVWLGAAMYFCRGIAMLVHPLHYLSRAAADERSGVSPSSHCSVLLLPAVAQASSHPLRPSSFPACFQVQAAALQTRVVPGPNAAAGSLALTGLYKGVVPLQAAVMGLTFFAAVIGEALHVGVPGAHPRP